MPSPRRLTWRKLAVYLAALLLLAFAEPRPTSFLIGCGLVALAWLLRVWAFGHLEKNVILVTTGPYAHTRNPAYLGSFLAAGNAETLQGRLVWAAGLLLALVFLVVYLPRKFRREYPRLRHLFGAELDRHAANVPSFLPRLTAWRSGDPRSFSWSRVADNHEWPWGLVLAGVLVLVWLAPRWSPLHGVLG